EFEIGACLRRRPVVLIRAFAGGSCGAVHHFNGAEARLNRGRGSGLRSLRRHHGIEKGKRQRRTKAPLKREERVRLFGDEGQLGSGCGSVGGSAATASSARRYWNGELFTIPRMKDEKRLSCVVAARSIARTVGMSDVSSTRPNPYARRFSVNAVMKA